MKFDKRNSYETLELGLKEIHGTEARVDTAYKNVYLLNKSGDAYEFEFSFIDKQDLIDQINQ